MSYSEFNIDDALYLGMAESGTNSKSFPISLADANYTIYQVWVSGCSNVGEVSTGLDITIQGGVLFAIPSQDTSNLFITKAINGNFKVSFDYKPKVNGETKPTVFNIYGDDVLLGTVTYRTGITHYAFTSSVGYSHNQVVEVGVKAVNGSNIRENSLTVSHTADAQGPSVIVDTESIELI